jgi:ABC-2 type transport system permease protein
MFAIYKRELKSYFHTFIGFLFIAVTLFFLGLYFTVYNLLNGYPYFSYVVSSVGFRFLVSVPVLTMRILAEEKRTKTDQLILTAPVSVAKIVAGKYLALLTIFAIPVAIICTYPLVMSHFGSVPMGEAYLAILAYFLFGAAAIAVGVLISSLTESQVIAAVLGFGVLFIGYMMSSICSVISSSGNLLTKILGCFDLHTHFSEMLNGVLNLESIVYYISLTVLVLFLTVQSIQKRRYSVSVKHISLGAYSTGMTAIAVAIAVVLNLVVAELPAEWTAVDVTNEKLYSLTDQTKEFIDTIQEDVTIYVLGTKDNQDEILAQTLERYEDSSEHIKVEYVDPTVNPMFASKYTDATLALNSLIVVSDKRNKTINYNNLYETSFDSTTYTSNTTGYDGEGQITSALDYVLADDMPKIYTTEGHGEDVLSGTFQSGLKKENVDYETISLLSCEQVPEDAAGLFIDGPTKDFSEDDAKKVISYLERGGNVILVTAYTGEPMPNLESILTYMGLHLEDGLVVEGDADKYYRSPFYLLPDTTVSLYTSGIHGNYFVFTPFGQGITVENEDAEDMSYTTFLKTSDKAYIKTNVADLEDYSKEEGDAEGSFAIGLAAEKTLDDGSATLVVYGSQQIFTDSCNSMVSGANLMLFTNTLSNFVHHEGSVSVPVKQYNVSTLTVPRSNSLLIAILTTVVLPVGCLLAGFVIWLKRRRR